MENWPKEILAQGNTEWNSLATELKELATKPASSAGVSWATAGYSVEENSDLDTSNESYISSDDERDDSTKV